ncbi:MAG: hypothetical protein GX640_20420 [Fibrobacter sp.]|nr:hypothetical protein [Fibrobacter sp.]
MDIASQQGYQAGAPRPQARSMANTIAGGSFSESFVGAASVALAILGLSGVLPFWMATIGVIALGVAFLIEGAAISSTISDLTAADKAGQLDITDIGGGMTTEFLAGLAGITLGILSLLGISSALLLGIAIITFGGAMVMGSPSVAQLNYLSSDRSNISNIQLIAREALGAASNLKLAGGIGTIVLGILAITDLPQYGFVLIGLITAGFTMFVSGSALGTRMVNLFRK